MASTRGVSEATPGPQEMPAFTSCWHLHPCPAPWHHSELREMLSLSFLAPVHRGNYMLAPTTHSCQRCHTVTIHGHAQHTMPCEGSVTESVPSGSLWALSLPLAPLSPQSMPTVWTTLTHGCLTHAPSGLPDVLHLSPSIKLWALWRQGPRVMLSWLDLQHLALCLTHTHI